MPPLASPTPTARQVRTTTAAVRWYVATYFGTPDDPGTALMFADRSRVGPFALDLAAFRAGDPATLFRLFVATAMFQRQRDVIVMKILRDMPPAHASEVTDQQGLVALSRAASCPHAQTVAGLRDECDLAKTTDTSRGTCRSRPELACHLKRHTEYLRRYGDFGKLPSSAALFLAESGEHDLFGLYSALLRKRMSRAARSRLLEEQLASVFRVGTKLAAMFLALASNPDLTPGGAPWEAGLDHTVHVVIDSNVDLFLDSIGGPAGRDYETKREFVRTLARGIDLRQLDPRLRRYNPRLVQQAMYLFTSTSNRANSDRDCSRLGPRSCRACPGALRDRCELRVA